MNVPYEVYCYVPIMERKEDSKSFNKNEFIIQLRGTKKSADVVSLKNFKIDNSETEKNAELKKLRNSKFRICIPDPSFLDGYLYFNRANYGYTNTIIEIKHEDLNDKFRYYITIDSSSFIRLIRESESIVDREITGTFSFGIVDSKGEACLPILEVEESDEIKEDKKIGEFISKGPFTTKWIPGHLYITKGRTKFLYLGEISDPTIYCENTYYSGKTYRMFADLINDCSGLIKTSEISGKCRSFIFECPEITITNSSSELNKYKGCSIEEFISVLLNRISTLARISRFFVKGSRTASVDLGEFIQPFDNSDISQLIKNKTREYLENLPNNEKVITVKNYYSKIGVLSGICPDFIKNDPALSNDYIKLQLKKFMDYYHGGTCYFKRKTADNIMDELKSGNNKYSYSSLLSLRTNIFATISDDELKNYLNEIINKEKGN